MFSAPKHNAHGLETVRIYYRWHPLFGRYLRLRRRAKYPRGEYVYCELPDGTVAGLPGWMTDSSACSVLDLGTAMPSATALAELRLLVDSLSSHSSAPLEKIPVEARHDPKEESGCADEPAAL